MTFTPSTQTYKTRTHLRTRVNIQRNDSNHHNCISSNPGNLRSFSFPECTHTHTRTHTYTNTHTNTHTHTHTHTHNGTVNAVCVGTNTMLWEVCARIPTHTHTHTSHTCTHTKPTHTHTRHTSQTHTSHTHTHTHTHTNKLPRFHMWLFNSPLAEVPRALTTTWWWFPAALDAPSGGSVTGDGRGRLCWRHAARAAKRGPYPRRTQSRTRSYPLQEKRVRWTLKYPRDNGSRWYGVYPVTCMKVQKSCPLPWHSHSTRSVLSQYTLVYVTTPSAFLQYTLRTPSVLSQYLLSTLTVLRQYITTSPVPPPSYPKCHPGNYNNQSVLTELVIPQQYPDPPCSSASPYWMCQYSLSSHSVLPQ